MLENVREYWDGLTVQEQDEALQLLGVATQADSCNFTSVLIRLVFKSDVWNTQKLFTVYPTEAAVAQAWKNGWVEASRLKTYCS